jgi:MFS transporter, LPLT family, lysophospholipid transporter
MLPGIPSQPRPSLPPDRSVLEVTADTTRRKPSAKDRASPAGLWSRGMVATLAAQFLSALADNALLFAALALIRKQGYPTWSGPLLQDLFVGAYILLAPFVGQFADARPKGLVMVVANVAKFAGALGLCLHANPFLSYGLVGAGAAANSPAKYGILGELATPAQLVKANGLLEASTIAAILLGAMAGGALADWSVEGALIAIAACYAASVASAFFIPRLARKISVERFSFGSSLTTFASQIRSLLKKPDARLAVIGTALFWGAGAALRFLIIAWVPVALNVTNNRLPAFLTAMVAAGIVVGAALAARFVKVTAVQRALPAGVLIGVGVCLLPLATAQPEAFIIMAFVGACSGFFVVPLDALLQSQGEAHLGVGSAIAIQNFFENFAMLAMVSCYSAASFGKVPVNVIAVGIGIFMALSISALALARRASVRRTHSGRPLS